MASVSLLINEALCPSLPRLSLRDYSFIFIGLLSGQPAEDSHAAVSIDSCRTVCLEAGRRVSERVNACMSLSVSGMKCISQARDVIGGGEVGGAMVDSAE